MNPARLISIAERKALDVIAFEPVLLYGSASTLSHPCRAGASEDGLWRGGRRQEFRRVCDVSTRGSPYFVHGQVPKAASFLRLLGCRSAFQKRSALPLPERRILHRAGFAGWTTRVRSRVQCAGTTMRSVWGLSRGNWRATLTDRVSLFRSLSALLELAISAATEWLGTGPPAPLTR